MSDPRAWSLRRDQGPEGLAGCQMSPSSSTIFKNRATASRPYTGCRYCRPFANGRPGLKPASELEKPSQLPQEPYDFKQEMQDEEKRRIKNAMEQCRFNQKKTAEFLGMTYHQLRGYLRKYELTEDES